MDEGGPAGAGFLGFVMLFIVGYLLWLTFIGPDDPDSKNPFICPPPPLGNGRTYNVADTKTHTYEEVCGGYATESSIISRPAVVRDTPTGESVSAVKLERFATGPKGTTPEREYVVISASSKNTEAVNVTGWRIASLVSGRIYPIPQASRLPLPGRTNATSDIWLSPGEHLVVSTGLSPIGVGFRQNICSGYLGEETTYVPALPRSCPRLRDHLPPTPEAVQTLGDSCLDFINTLGRCEYHDSSLPYPQYRPECATYVAEHANYIGCVTDFKDTPEFYGSEWRAYLSRSEEIWRSSREVIRLYDNVGTVIDTYSY